MQIKQPYSKHATTAKRPWVWLVLVGFLWLQFAGTLHKYVHAPVVMHQATAEGSQSFDALFPEHTKQSGSDCQLLDLHCFGVALSQAMPILALPVFALQTAWHKTTVFDTRIRVVYLARAPPALI